MAARLDRREVVAGGLAVGLIVLAAAALVAGFAPFERRTAWIVVLALWIAGASGLIAWLRAGARDAGVLLASSAACGLAAAAIPPVARTPGLEEALGTVAAALFASSIAAAVSPVWWRPSLAVGLAVGTVALLVPDGVRPVGLAALPVLALGVIANRGGRVPAWAPGIALLPLVAGIVPADLVPASGAVPRVVTAVTLAVAASLLTARLVADAESGRRILNAALAGEADTDPRRAGGAVRRLGALVGDDRLRIGFWNPSDGTFRDATGARVPGPEGREDAADAAARTRTRVDLDGEPVALVEHPRGALADAGSRAALARGAALVVAQARLESEVTRQASELARSRERLIAAADEERRALRSALEAELAPRLGALERSLDDSAMGPLEQVREAQREVDAILEGLPPLALGRDDLADALRELAARLPAQTDVRVSVASAPDNVEARTALYFTCAEGLTNVARHAGATRVRVILDDDGVESRLMVEDDGIGGAIPTGGTGLIGIRDRLDAVGGHLAVDSPQGGGTRVVAVVPRGRAPLP